MKINAEFGEIIDLVLYSFNKFQANLKRGGKKDKIQIMLLIKKMADINHKDVNANQEHIDFRGLLRLPDRPQDS